MRHTTEERKLTYSKVFRWRRPAGQTDEPSTLEVAGTFTEWRKVRMTHDAVSGWHLTLHHIPGNRTHHYMFFADGKPVRDEHCDGLAVPHGAQEERSAITTARGPRVFMLFAQTK